MCKEATVGLTPNENGAVSPADWFPNMFLLLGSWAFILPNNEVLSRDELHRIPAVGPGRCNLLKERCPAP